jgi:hypothetical protein
MKKSELEKIFRKLDLQVRSTGHRYGWLVVNGRKILRVHFSHGKGDIPLTIAQKIRGQLKLSQEDFLALLKCTLGFEAYIGILVEW